MHSTHTCITSAACRRTAVGQTGTAVGRPPHTPVQGGGHNTRSHCAQGCCSEEVRSCCGLQGGRFERGTPGGAPLAHPPWLGAPPTPPRAAAEHSHPHGVRCPGDHLAVLPTQSRVAAFPVRSDALHPRLSAHQRPPESGGGGCAPGMTSQSGSRYEIASSCVALLLRARGLQVLRPPAQAQMQPRQTSRLALQRL